MQNGEYLWELDKFFTAPRMLVFFALWGLGDGREKEGGWQGFLFLIVARDLGASGIQTGITYLSFEGAM